ncbi:MAG: hypothetical protein ACTHK7_01070, partial [Aureliella sp.]
MRCFLAWALVFGSLFCLSACKPRSSERATATSTGEHSAAKSSAPVKPDDAAVVATLEKAGAVLKKNSSGQVVQVDMRDAGGGNEELFAAAAKLPALQTIICTGAGVTDAAVAPLRGHASLQRLDAAERSMLGDAAAEVLATIPNLADLNLQKSEISDAAYPHLAKLAKLKRLRAPFTKTGDAGLKALANSTQLELLDFRDCTGVSDEGIAA